MQHTQAFNINQITVAAYKRSKKDEKKGERKERNWPF